MSFVSKGEKKMRNMARKAGAGADGAPTKDGFGKKGDGERPGAAHNMAPGSKDKTKQPVSEDAGSAAGYADEATASKSEYDPASGKRAKTVADLRNASKLLSERSDAGEASPTGKEGGQDAKHTSSSKNASGFMQGAGMSKMDKMSKAKPTGEADQMGDEMVDPMDEDEEDSEQTKIGMTPKGKSREKMTSLKMLKKRIAELA